MIRMISNQISLILISTSSLLVDRILRSDLLTARIQCQLCIWLALTLSIPRPISGEHDDDSNGLLLEPWLHLTLSATVGSIFIQSQQDQLVPSRSTVSTGNRLFLDVIPLVSVASWMTSLALVVVGANGNLVDRDVVWSFQVFAVSLVLLWVGRWHLDRQASIAREGPAIYYPTTTPLPTSSSFSSSMPPDETQWYTWDVLQTWQWLSQLLMKHEENFGHPTTTTVLRLLAPHRLRGDVLDSLTILHLVEALQVPYGPAVLIYREITLLAQRYPKPQLDYCMTAGSQQDYPSYLEAHDREYYHFNDKGMGHLHRGVKDGELGTSPITSPSMDPELEERLTQVMRERYGLELPAMKTSSTGTNQEGGTESSPPEEWIDRRTSHVDTEPSRSVPIVELNRPEDAIDPAVLAQMPARIREIVERRPDLAKALLTQKMQRQRNQQTPILEEEEVDEDVDGFDDEMTSLVQRRPRFKSQSTKKEII